MGCSPINKQNKKQRIVSSFHSVLTFPTDGDKLKENKESENFPVKERKCSPSKFYDELEVLGQGSFGTVVKVRQKHTNPPVYRAMKKLSKAHLDNDKESEECLINEINILKSLDHPNIMKIYEYFNTDDYLYIISELCVGGELFDKIIEEKYFSENSTKFIMKQLFSAVNFCHCNNVIHRDLKPENILLTKSNINSLKDFQIKIIDFGTSARIHKGKMLKRLIGSPFYIAPEVLMNSYNEKCDMWSLGVIMYILLYGTPPFYGANDDEIYQSVLKGEFTFDHQNSNIKISDDAKDLISKLLEKDISKRLSSDEALNHKWVSDINMVAKHIVGDTAIKISKNLRSFYVAQKTHQATLATSYKITET